MEGVRDAIDSLSESENAAARVLSGVLSRHARSPNSTDRCAIPLPVLESGEAQLRESGLYAETYADRIELDPERLRDVEQRLEAMTIRRRKFRTRPRRCLSFWLSFGHA